MTVETKYRVGYVFGHYAALFILAVLVASLGCIGGMMYANTRIRVKVFKEVIALQPKPIDDLNAADVCRLVSRHAHPRISFHDLKWLDDSEDIPLRGIRAPTNVFVFTNNVFFYGFPEDDGKPILPGK